MFLINYYVGDSGGGGGGNDWWMGDEVYKWSVTLFATMAMSCLWKMDNNKMRV